MVSSKKAEPEQETSKQTRSKAPLRVVVLRWGHRAVRDARLTSHVALTARAFGASGFILSDAVDEKIRETVERITKRWGGPFHFDMEAPWRAVVKDWKTRGGIVVHLTAYGENIQTSNVMNRIKSMERPILVIAGSQKVPAEFFTKKVADFNVAVGNQPHSECSSLAIFLDRLFDGKELKRGFTSAKIRIIPQKHGKKVATHGKVSRSLHKGFKSKFRSI